MTSGRRVMLIMAVTALLSIPGSPVLGDEGMWPFNNIPEEHLEKVHHFKATKEWLENVQKSSVRFNSGGSGSFISADGLVITNHHVGADALHKLGGLKNKNYYRDGFHAKTRDEEFKCEAMELNVLMEIIDVTKEVNKAVAGIDDPAKAAVARRGAIATIEKDAKEKYKLKPQVVTLYQGGAYNLYLYKKYTDVRLVFAPEQQIAFYGGDPDNFEYPRYDLDICIFRVYEDNKPVKLKHYLKWASKPLKKDELVFVSGNPGRTDRMDTVAELHYLRDHGMPFQLQRLFRRDVLLSTYSDRSEENRRQAKELFFGVQNSRKARIGMLAALLDPAVMAAKKKEEARLKEEAEKNDKLAGARTAWERIAKAQEVRRKHLKRYQMLENGVGFWTDYFGIARTLVRAGEERAKPNDERLREYGDARLESLKEQLFDTAKIYPRFEIVKLTDSLTFLCEELGYSAPLVQKVLAGKSPVERARELVNGTKLADVELRKKLYEGGKEAIDESKDPMILLAKLVDPASRAVRKIMETEVEEVMKQSYNEISKVKFALDGTRTYPDATFTLRLSFGLVKGYNEGGKKIPFTTTFAGLYERSRANNDKPPFDLPKRWVEAKDKLNLKTPFNFVSTADIIGGNSGSPVINRAGEFVGIIFDGNIQSLSLDYAYSDVQARAVSVDAQAIIEALRKVYDAGELADEMTGKKS
jgi:hypothetical protein